MKTVNSEYYGDETRWFIGVVVNSSPPPGLEGRIKIRIHGVHDPYSGNVPESDLPWATVALPLTEGGSPGIGRIPQVLPGAFVYGIFMDGKSSQIPLVLGSMTKLEFPTDVQIKSSKDKAFSQFKSNYDPDRKLNTVTESIEDDELPKVNVAKRRSQCMMFFIDNNYTPRQAAGITGCIEAISQFVTHDPDNLNSPYFGIGKWIRGGSRFNALFQFAGQFSQKQLNTRFSIQLQFVLYELRTTFSPANSKLLKTEVIDGDGGSVDVISRYYMKDRTIAGGNITKSSITTDRGKNLAIELATTAYEQATSR